MSSPSKLLLKLTQRLFKHEGEQAEFIAALLKPQSFHPCILWCQPKPDSPFTTEPPLPWQPEFVDRLALKEKPGRHPLHNAGDFYCLDFSSVFAAAPLLTIEHCSMVIDVCSSPGGKSIFAHTALQPKTLLCNEVIGKRTAALIANLKRCQINPAIVLSVDSQILAEAIPQTADVVLVDAPCTGQSLIAKGGKAPGCFHPVSINKNANRQKRILANSAQLVAPQGYLAYMTCTYSPEENEQVCEWFLERFSQFQAIAIPHLSEYRSPLTSLPCYRIFPQSRLGAGAFTILLQNNNVGQTAAIPEEFFNRPKVTVL